MRISGITYVSRKTHNVRNTFIVLLIVTALILLLMSGVSLFAAWKAIHPARTSIPVFSANIVPEHQDISFSDINKKVTLKGWYFDSKGSDRTIIMAHGYGLNRLQFHEQTLDMIKSFLGKSYNVLVFDFRNSGLSGGNMTTFGLYEKDDLLGAIRLAKAQGSKQIILMGFSSGASASLLAAAQSPDVSAVIVDSPVADLEEYMDSGFVAWNSLKYFPLNRMVPASVKLLAGLDPSDVSPKNIISKLSPRPILFIHSINDSKVPAANSRELYDLYSRAAGDKAQLWEAQGSEHGGSYKQSPQQYTEKVLDFLSKIPPSKAK